jgi:hypothetical protein
MTALAAAQLDQEAVPLLRHVVLILPITLDLFG